MAFLYIAPLAFYQGLKDTEFQWSMLLEKKTLFYILFSGATMGAWSSLLTLSAEMTVLSHTALLSNCGCIIIIIAMMVLGHKVGHLEIIGCIMAISGCAYSVTDKNSFKADGSAPSLLGDGLAILASVFSAIYMMVGKNIGDHVPNLVRTAVVQLAAIIA